MADPAFLQRWEDAAARIAWRRQWNAVYEPGGRGGSWFPGATLNAAENCVDRHLPAHADKVALHWEGEPGDRRTITYRELHDEICAFADALRGLGVGPGDRVALYMGLLPETVVAMLACARVGAVNSLMAAALPADALADRLADLAPKVLVTQDGSWRHGVILPLKARADEAIPAAAGIEHTVVVRRTGIDVAWYEGDRWYDELIVGPRPGTRGPSGVGLTEPPRSGGAGSAGAGAETAEPPEAVPSEHPLLVVYIANRRGRPTGIVHGTGGFLTYAAEVHADGLTESPDDVVWCPVEIGWVVGQTHGVYGPLACAGTSVIYEGMLDTPTHARSWDVIERHRVTTLVTTPSIVRTLRRWVDSPPREGQLDSVRRVVTGGEPCPPELRDWARRRLAPQGTVADAWGQTELGGMVVLSDGVGSPTLPRPTLDVVDGDGRPLGVGGEGELVLRDPWPAAFIGIQNEALDAVEWHWNRYDGAYATGDRAAIEPEGSFVFLGRIDPMVNVSAQLVSLTEIQEALLEHPFVGEAEIVERVERAGPALAACVVLTDSIHGSDDLAQALREHVRERLGGLAQPRTVAFVDSFPPDLDAPTRRQALQVLCAAAKGDDLFISTKELLAAAKTVRPSEIDD